MSFAIPAKRLRETETLLAFYHPKASYPFHVLLVAKKAVASRQELDARDSAFLTDLYSTVQSLVGNSISRPIAWSSMAGSLRTTATRDGDEYVIEGHKIWTSYSDVADWCLLLARTDPSVPKHKALSAFAVPMHQRGIEQRPLRMINGITTETLFARRDAEGDVLALGMRELSLAEHVVNIVRMLVYYAIMVVLFLAAWMTVRLLQGRRYEFTFRDRLLGALLLTSLVPVVVLALYGRSLARERLQETTGAVLAQETSQVIRTGDIHRLRGTLYHRHHASSRFHKRARTGGDWRFCGGIRGLLFINLPLFVYNYIHL